MKIVDKYIDLGITDSESIFEYLINNLKETIRTYDFYVAWDKVLGNVNKIEVSLNILNSLIGKSNIKVEFAKLIKAYPEIVSVIPVLIACRDYTVKVATIDGDIDYKFIKKSIFSDNEIEEIIIFIEKCGLLKIFADKSIKNLVDYCIGVEVGLDTNARKNRSGTAMENLTEVYVKTICEKFNYQYLTQATVMQIKSQFGIDVPTDKSDRHFDFAIFTGSKIYLMEVNYYGGGGSKLKSVAGEFKSLFELFSLRDDIGFVWITDGLGWNTAKRPLLETFNATDFVINIKMIEQGVLEEILTKGL